MRHVSSVASRRTKATTHNSNSSSAISRTTSSRQSPCTPRRLSAVVYSNSSSISAIRSSPSTCDSSSVWERSTRMAFLCLAGRGGTGMHGWIVLLSRMRRMLLMRWGRGSKRMEGSWEWRMGIGRSMRPMTLGRRGNRTRRSRVGRSRAKRRRRRRMGWAR